MMPLVLRPASSNDKELTCLAVAGFHRDCLDSTRALNRRTPMPLRSVPVDA